MIAHTCGLLTFTLTSERWLESREHTLSLSCFRVLPAYLFCTALSGGCGKGRKQRVILRPCVKLIQTFFFQAVLLPSGKMQPALSLFQLAHNARSQSWETAERLTSSVSNERATSKLSGRFWMNLCESVWRNDLVALIAFPQKRSILDLGLTVNDDVLDRRDHLLTWDAHSYHSEEHILGEGEKEIECCNMQNDANHKDHTLVMVSSQMKTDWFL